MFGITKIVKGYSIQTYYLCCYAIFISEDITRQRGGVTFRTPCMFKCITCITKCTPIFVVRPFLKTSQRYCQSSNTLSFHALIGSMKQLQKWYANTKFNIPCTPYFTSHYITTFEMAPNILFYLKTRMVLFDFCICNK